MDNENSKKKDIETIEVEWVVYSQNDRVVRKYFQVHNTVISILLLKENKNSILQEVFMIFR